MVPPPASACHNGRLSDVGSKSPLDCRKRDSISEDRRWHVDTPPLLQCTAATPSATSPTAGCYASCPPGRLDRPCSTALPSAPGIPVAISTTRISGAPADSTSIDPSFGAT
jgi:hypothetical protein